MKKGNNVFLGPTEKETSINLSARDGRFKTGEEELFDVQITLTRMKVIFLVFSNNLYAVTERMRVEHLFEWQQGRQGVVAHGNRSQVRCLYVTASVVIGALASLSPQGDL